MRWPRWAQKQGEHIGLSDLTVAVDEIYELRVLLAYEAAVLEAHLEFKTFPKSRRKLAEEQVERMRAAARGEVPTRSRISRHHLRHILSEAGAHDTLLTNSQWAEQRGLVRVDEEDE